jgi:ankyrin repeat protein
MALLDQHNGVVDVCDDDGWTALHKASFHKDADAKRLEFEQDEVTLDSDHELVSQHHWIVELLLQQTTNISSTTLTGDTPLLLAAKQANIRCLRQFVARMAESDINRRDSDNQTALYYAAKARDLDMLSALLGSVMATDFGAAGTEMEREILAWAADDSERLHIFAMVAQKGSLMTKKNVPDTHRESALCWAAWNADLELVCKILNSSASDSNADKDRKSIEAVASRMLSGMKSAYIQRSKNLHTKPNATKHIDWKAQKDGDHPGKEQPTTSAAERDKYETILDLLRNPPIVPTTVSIQPCEMPVLRADLEISAFDAAVVDFYAKEKSSGFLRRERGIKEVIYDPEKGPAKLMAAAQETMKAQSHHLGTANVFSPDDFKFR